MTENLKKNLEYCLKGDIWAVKLCIDLFEIAQVWDDLIDRDNNVNDDKINEAFIKALVELPSNPFYYEHIVELKTLVMNVILQWLDANVLEKGSFRDKIMAYMLRAGIYQVFNYCAYLVGGIEWAKKIGPDMRRLYGETLKDFLKEMK